MRPDDRLPPGNRSEEGGRLPTDNPVILIYFSFCSHASLIRQVSHSAREQRNQEKIMKNTHLGITAVLTATTILAFSMITLQARTVKVPFDPGNFDSPQDNAYLPMAENLTYTYMAEDEDGLIVNPITQTADRKSILGVEATVVHDIEYIMVEGVGTVLVEDTIDWIAWDNDGNVWYLGEDATAYEYDDDWQLVSTSKEGSWEAGVEGAEPGILMLAHPRVGDSYRQEFAEGEAEDMAKIVNLHATVTLNEFVEDDVHSKHCLRFKHCLKTKEWSPLEPGVIEQKYYAPGIGLVEIHEHHGKLLITQLVEIE